MVLEESKGATKADMKKLMGSKNDISPSTSTNNKVPTISQTLNLDIGTGSNSRKCLKNLHMMPIKHTGLSKSSCWLG